MKRLMVLCIASVLSVPVSAQTQRDSTAMALRAGFDEVSGWLAKAADIVPADKYGYKPVATVRSFGEQIGHVVDGYNYYCAQATGKRQEWSDGTEKGKTDKATLAAKLKAATEVCAAAYTSGQTAPLMANVAHTSLHYGNMITYIRMLGLVPPSS